tara:strand:+ start:5709 stop:7268 length:1560 start_codon:yes stop_codon:yes gene_type:complete
LRRAARSIKRGGGDPTKVLEQAALAKIGERGIRSADENTAIRGFRDRTQAGQLEQTLQGLVGKEREDAEGEDQDAPPASGGGNRALNQGAADRQAIFRKKAADRRAEASKKASPNSNVSAAESSALDEAESGGSARGSSPARRGLSNFSERALAVGKEESSASSRPVMSKINGKEASGVLSSMRDKANDKANAKANAKFGSDIAKRNMDPETGGSFEKALADYRGREQTDTLERGQRDREGALSSDEVTHETGPKQDWVGRSRERLTPTRLTPTSLDGRSDKVEVATMGDTFEDTTFRTRADIAGSNRQLASGMGSSRRPDTPRVNAPTPQIDMDTEYGDETPKSFFETGLAASQEENFGNALRLSEHQARVRADHAQMKKGFTDAVAPVVDLLAPVVAPVAGAVGSAKDAVVGAAGSAKDAVVGAAGSASDAVVGAVGNAKNEVVEQYSRLNDYRKNFSWKNRVDTYAREQGEDSKTPLRSLALAATRPRASTPLEKQKLAKKKKTASDLNRAMNLSK